MLLQIKNLSKSFFGVKALDEVSFDLKAGEVHTLMGENGAGKSTLMKILIGILQPDAGEIFLDGKEVEIKDVHQMLNLGIAMIHQEIMDIPELTVAENIFLGREKSGKFFLKKQEAERDAQQILNDLGIDLPLKKKAKDLSISQKQMVEIAKAVSMNARIIIMDEPTSSLSETGSEALFSIIKDLKAKSVSIIYISHKMDEILQISDRVTVLRDGKHIATDTASDLDKQTLINRMVGRDLDSVFPEIHGEKGRVVLKITNLSTSGKFENINFSLAEGEILGFAGLMGAGRSELARAIYGLDKFDSGEITFSGEKMKKHSIQSAIKNGIGYLSEDRKKEGIIPQESIYANASLTALSKFSGFGFLQKKEELKKVKEITDELRLKSAGLNQKIMYLSGGNQQKVLLSRVLLTNPTILILDEPTRGIDIGAKMEIYQLIKKLAENGIAIILISSELPELIGLAHRILVMSQGKQQAILNKSEFSSEEIMKHAIHQ